MDMALDFNTPPTTTLDERVEEVVITPSIEDCFPDMNKLEVQFFSAPGWEEPQNTIADSIVMVDLTGVDSSFVSFDSC